MPLRKSLFTVDDQPGIARRNRTRPGDVDITPMIDVTFLLLIFFMVSSTMQSAPPLDLPPANHSKGVTVSSSIVVTVKAPRGAESTPVILLGDGQGPEATPSDLQRFLGEQQKSGLSRVVIKAEGDVPHGFVTEVARAVKSVDGLEMYLGVGDYPKH